MALARPPAGGPLAGEPRRPLAAAHAHVSFSRLSSCRTSVLSRSSWASSAGAYPRQGRCIVGRASAAKGARASPRGGGAGTMDGNRWRRNVCKLRGRWSELGGVALRFTDGRSLALPPATMRRRLTRRPHLFPCLAQLQPAPPQDPRQGRTPLLQVGRSRLQDPQGGHRGYARGTLARL